MNPRRGGRCRPISDQGLSLRFAVQVKARAVGLTLDHQISFRSAMPNRNELLANHYLRVAGIAAVDADGTIGTQNIVGVEIPSVLDDAR